MAKVKEKKKLEKPEAEKFRFPLTRSNYYIILLGVAVIIFAYIFMYLPDDPDAFLTRTLAPVMLVFAYLIVIPIGLFYRDKKVKK
ncbi:MAG: hypothetical protein EH225_01195 [Calditrichaeota bacterium]|nr:MAG: hypothetical protein EH225_01195 [Calditrichota bacterium]